MASTYILFSLCLFFLQDRPYGGQADLKLIIMMTLDPYPSFLYLSHARITGMRHHAQHLYLYTVKFLVHSYAYKERACSVVPLSMYETVSKYYLKQMAKEDLFMLTVLALRPYICQASTPSLRHNPDEDFQTGRQLLILILN